eukprot:CAMPEP_0181516222 /NCGR_PEP_ID=MMETSP1110-20121109/64000_1 /TAXON_ID=174948 /ORGANISM="Symbiodinium sp., Strain CCMP421" /LENGTH=96 /DNA_ID=CAMNT_0023646307 /DNA_START=41 /DNA_END=331 /DNA_ORIENTATION=+
MLLSAAGTLPLPAVSVPKEKVTCPSATETPEPEEEPPEIMERSKEFWQAPYGDLTPTRPVAAQSMFVFPMTIAPLSCSFRTTAALSSAIGAVRGGR